MDGMLSQEEINALLGSMDESSDTSVADDNFVAGDSSSIEKLSPEECDALGEISNISMGTAATTLSILVNNRVVITTPRISYVTLEDISEQCEEPCVFIYISYQAGLEGKNILILKEQDVKVITDLMMGGDGTNTENELSDLHLSAISEAMNQMMGSAATSMSSMINEKVDISPPSASRVDFAQEIEDQLKEMGGKIFVEVSFKMEIGDLVDSEIMQLYPIEFAREVYERFIGNIGVSEEANEPEPVAAAPVTEPTPPKAELKPEAPVPQPSAMYQEPMGSTMQMPPGAMPAYTMPQPNLNIQPAGFQSFSPVNLGANAPENIDLIMDVPLEVTVELGRTNKSIHDILDFAPGTIIELNKLAGEPIDVLVNGKFVAKGEVVVIEESFGIRVTEILKD